MGAEQNSCLSDGSPHTSPSTARGEPKGREDWESGEAKHVRNTAQLWHVPEETQLREDWESDESRAVPQPRRTSHSEIGVAGI